MVAPALGLVGLVAAAVAIVVYFPLLVGDVNAAGDQRFGATSAVLLALIVLSPVAGWVQAVVLRRRRPETYARITEAIG